MIKFFRKIRQNLLSEGKTGKYIKYAFGEIVLVVIGILIALSINNWNENRKIIVQEQFILKRLKADINTDISSIVTQMEYNNRSKKELTFVIDVILGNTVTDLQNFRKNLRGLLAVNFFNHNKTTFNNIVSSGQIEYIQNKILTDSITKYYNNNYKGWDSAMSDYTRNIMAPFMLNFDHVPQSNDGLEGYENFTKVDINKSKINSKSIKEYQDNVFFLNILRQKIFVSEGQQMEYQKLKIYMEQLLKQIDSEIKK
ncbi:DUF6090 family protein [Hyunsoonleella aestuarii]|uniref:Uncharacterized protein n=1 Tax=Hyunsoonleella aestuarii TaxID=912802 RepID=A0ABP8E9W8_9FLAO|nr:DUF6090 family protein [Hyunsoonleella aestuarii]